ncbi:MAG: hypothetical protein KAS36_04445 [Anaerolineales bacterium]|nr:hypothetical protein [Anaerolineales bacterium]
MYIIRNGSRFVIEVNGMAYHIPDNGCSFPVCFVLERDYTGITYLLEQAEEFIWG